jgi:putative endonuclease
VFGLGRRGEAKAAKILRKRGYKIVATNYSCPPGEIDIVAIDGGTLAFVEVKARTSAAFGEAAAQVTPEKRRRLIAAAHHYLAAHPTESDIRFDVVAITGEDAIVIVDAFRS